MESKLIFRMLDETILQIETYMAQERTKDKSNIKCTQNAYQKKMSMDFLSYYTKNAHKVDQVYKLLDADSRKIFCWIIKARIAYAMLGNTANELFPYDNIAMLPCNGYISASITFLDNELYQCNQYIISSTETTIENTWLRQEYLLMGECEPMQGYTVISGGSYCGETAIWFVDKVGSGGKVYAFEPTPHSYSRLLKNIEYNNLSSVIQPINLGLWSTTRKMFLFEKKKDTANNLRNDLTNIPIDAVSIDDFLLHVSCHNVDFIKLDVEGAEKEVILGARNTIIKYHPKLAIAGYHHYSDLLDIPLLINNLNPEYRLRLSHKNKTFYETVLFAY